MAAVPEVVGVNVDVHVADAVVPLKVHVVNDPVTPVSVRETVPVGVLVVPAAVSVTVTVQVDAWLATTGVVQLTAVVVVLKFTVMLVAAVLPLCVESPGYEAVTAAVPAAGPLNVEVHVADAVVPDSVHVVNVPPVTPVSERATVPVGVVAPVLDVSVTVTVHVEPWLMKTGVVQLTAVVVG
jgi:hypothetical protein